jgi:hypothetical protein
MRPFELFADATPIAPSPAGGALRLVEVANAASVMVLLVLACVWLCLRPRHWHVVRRLRERGRAAGSLHRYLWAQSLRIVRATPWLVVGIVAIGAAWGLLLGRVFGIPHMTWLGPCAALLGATLAPAWGDTVARWHRRRT